MSDRIALIGTGLSGMVQALALLRRGFDVTLIGPEPGTKDDHRSTAILLPGIAFLTSLHLWDAIKSSSTPLATMELIDGKKHSVFDAHEINEMNFGYNVSNTALKNALLAALKKSKNLTWHKQNATAFSKIENGWQITCANGKKVDAQLLIGADGRNSPVREACNIRITEKHIDQTAMVGIAKAEKSHFNTTVEWYRQGGPMTLVPIENNQFAFVWCSDHDTQQQRKDMNKAELEKEFSALTEHRFGKLKLQNTLQLWTIRPFLANNMIAEHCALIGEAAHALPPIGAQGFNASLQDIMALTNTLEQGKRIGYRLNDAVLLSGYEKTRLPEIHLRASAINTLNATLLSHHRLPHRLRRFSLNSLQHFAFVKKQMMQIGLSPIRMS